MPTTSTARTRPRVPLQAWRSSPPRQRRAHDTMERFAEAAETLLKDRAFERITVQEIVAQAGRPIGSFYARFNSKDALLPFLYDRYDRTLVPHVQGWLAAVDWEKLDFARAVAGVVEILVESYLERRWLLRALALFARQHPEALTDELVDRRRRLYDEVAQVLLRHRRRILHEDPEQAARFGVYLVASVARERLLFSEAPLARATALPAGRLREELTRALHGYLAFGPRVVAGQARRRAHG